jgi:CBS domain-containing protein
MTKIPPEIALHFRDQLRDARALALRDAEAFHEIVFVLERLGAYLEGRIGDLGKYRGKLCRVPASSPMAVDVPSKLPELHSSFEVRYELVRKARNSALHDGALARHLTVNATELSLVLEEALMNANHRAADFMVRNPVCAHLWQPLSFIRQTMLVNSFSYLPVPILERGKTSWQIVSDFGVAQYLRRDGEVSKDRLVQTLQQAVDEGGLPLLPAKTCGPDDKVQDVLRVSEGFPSLVLSTNDKQLLGILTSFDLL